MCLLKCAAADTAGGVTERTVHSIGTELLESAKLCILNNIWSQGF